MKLKSLPKTLFVTGIGTDVGKSYATGWLAAEFARRGENVITQKFVQTGNVEYSEDIATHRRIMGIPLTADDKLHITAPVIFTYPASADLAARLDGKKIELRKIEEATETLASRYDRLLIEGAGGIMVPLDGEYLTIDYVRDHRLPTVVVTNGQLGSINHTLLTIEAMQVRGIEISAVVYNPHFDKDRIICNDTRDYLQKWIVIHSPQTLWLEMPDEI